MIDPYSLRTPQLWAILLLFAFGILTCNRVWAGRSQRLKRGRSTQPLTPLSHVPKKEKLEFSEDDFYRIDALEDLDLENEEPLQLRPFKAKYHLTMALENTPANDLIAMDKTYHSRISLRRHLLRTHPDEVLAWTPAATSAVKEFYEWLTSTYLPRRFPTVYTLQTTGLQNHATGETLPLIPATTEVALQILGANIDDDFLFLLPEQAGEEKGKYRLQGFVTCFPSGFATKEKVGHTLADIHAPVPGYATKLEKSMDRFFAALPVGRIVKRSNWGVTTDDRLFAPGGNHMSEFEHAARKEEMGKGVEFGDEEVVDLRQTVLRCERQTLHRLPKTGAMVFAFKTYQYPLRELREECGVELADTIEGLGKGSVPEIRVYKREIVWGKKVKAFLRGGIDIDGERIDE